MHVRNCQLYMLSNVNKVLFYMLGMNFIKLIFGYVYFPPTSFPKIKQDRLSVYRQFMSF